MQLLAIITMLIDHIGIVFYPDQPLFRLIGRIAFPLYAYGIVAGLRYTSNRTRYIRRLAVIAAAAQLPYMLALDVWGFNVVATFLVVIGVLWVQERWSNQPMFWIIAAMLAALIMDEWHFDYGSYALFLMLIYRHVPQQWMTLVHLALNLVYFYYAGWELQLASVIATALLAYGQPLLQALDRLKPPRWLWLGFYPGHLLLLAVARVLLR